MIICPRCKSWGWIQRVWGTLWQCRDCGHKFGVPDERDFDSPPAVVPTEGAEGGKGVKP